MWFKGIKKLWCGQSARCGAVFDTSRLRLMLAHAQQYRHPRNAKQHIHTLPLTSSHYTEVCLASQRKHAASPVVRRSTPARSRCFKISLVILG